MGREMTVSLRASEETGLLFYGDTFPSVPLSVTTDKRTPPLLGPLRLIKIRLQVGQVVYVGVRSKSRKPY